jgi:hypothetical protein
MLVFKQLFSFLKARCSIVRSIGESPVCLSVEEVTDRAGQEVLMEVDDKISLIVGDP